jgi:hypothetical protein
LTIRQNRFGGKVIIWERKIHAVNTRFEQIGAWNCVTFFPVYVEIICSRPEISGAYTESISAGPVMQRSKSKMQNCGVAFGEAL